MLRKNRNTSLHLIRVSGRPFPLLYVQVEKPFGRFPKTKSVDLPNIRHVGTTTKITKRDLPPIRELYVSELLLLVDFWRTNKDDELVQQTVPGGIESEPRHF